MKGNSNSAEVSGLDKLLWQLDEFPLSAVWRIGAGFAFFPLLHFAGLSNNSYRVVIPALLAFLLSLRVLFAVARNVLPFSKAVRDVWFGRRQLGKRFDSYQWQKLFWFGLGILLEASMSRSLSSARLVVSALCLFFGVFGMIRWFIFPPEKHIGSGNAVAKRTPA